MLHNTSQNGHHLKDLQTINAGEDVEKRERSCTVGRNVTWLSHYREQYGDFLKKKKKQKPRNKTTIWPSNPITGHLPWENHNSKRHMYPSVRCSIIIVAKTQKQSRCPWGDEWIKKMWHIYTKEYHPARKLNELESVLVRWMNLLYRVK